MKKSQNFYATIEECEKSEKVRKAFLGVRESEEGLKLNLRVAILWHETGRQNKLTKKELYIWGEYLFGGHNTVMGLRKIAQAGDGQYWVPVNLCTPEARHKAEKAFNTDRDYHEAYNEHYPVGGIPTISPIDLLAKIENTPRGGDCAFYCLEIKCGRETFWKLGVSWTKDRWLGRIRHRQSNERYADKDASIICHAMITDIATKKDVLSLEKDVQNAFGDICRRWPKNPTMRFGKEQFADDERIRKFAEMLNPLSNAPQGKLKHFKSSK